MKQLVLCLVGLLLGAALLFPSVGLVEEESCLLDFSVNDDKVYLECSVTLQNHTSAEQCVRLHASLPEDVRGGLLLEPDLYAMAGEEMAVFTLPPYTRRCVDVTFVGRYGGTACKQNRLLPRIDVLPAATPCLTDSRAAIS